MKPVFYLAIAATVSYGSVAATVKTKTRRAQISAKKGVKK